MNISENIRNYKKKRKSIREYTHKITEISAASCPRAASTVLKLYSDKVPLPSCLTCKLSNFHIHKYE